MQYHVEAVKTFALDGDDFEEANEAYDTENSGSYPWKSTQGFAV